MCNCVVFGSLQWLFMEEGQIFVYHVNGCVACLNSLEDFPRPALCMTVVKSCICLM